MAVADRLPRLIGDQARASAPDAHKWLTASAGTGKTQVLAARVFRLLLRGTDPAAILCLTFTKAAAAEMAQRISARLAAWVRMAEPDLKKDLFALGDDPNDVALRTRARTLFARLLDAPGGGIRVSTIHGFCQGLLAGFPLEAGLIPGFRPIEGREEATLSRETMAAWLSEAEAHGRLAIGDAVAALSLRLGEGGAEEFLRECAHAGEALAALPTGGIQPFVRAALDLPRGDIGEALAAACADDVFDVTGLRALAAMNVGWGTARGLERADRIAAWLGETPQGRAAMLAELHLVWATSTGALRSFAKGQAPPVDDYAPLATRLFEACDALLAAAARADYADLLAQALAAGRDYAEAYAAAKRRLGVADFDDLIGATIALLDQPGMGAWVRYKLDQSTEHVLVDEAQDTNPRQWRIVRALTEEFFAGAGTRDEMRTLFVVGDYKQAIFGFQGTDPIFFAAAEQLFAKLAEGAEEAGDDRVAGFERLSLTHSFRSTRPVLEFVDAAIAVLPEPGLGLIGDAAAHASEVPGPGSVTLWPPVVAGGSDADEEEWAGDATRALATKIAKTIARWLDPVDPLMLRSKGRALRPEDVMILVKRRGELASLIVARLYAEGVPVAGVDRLRLNAPLAVRDLLTALRFALQPEDDLSLAALLVSPLLGWSQDELLAAAAPRDTALWRHLRAHVGDDRLAPLYDLLARADLAAPYQLLEHLLSGPLDGRRKLLRRLGAEARDPIDELLRAALDFESVATPTLQGFLDWFDRGEVEIVRDAAAPLDAVRVMTAHGAKGLQAPLVMLADACADPASAPRSLLRWTPPGADAPLPAMRPKGAERSGPLAALVEEAAARELQEHWRLFYVAATRAEEQLVIAGALGPRAQGVPPAASWYSAADRAFRVLGIDGEGERVFEGRALAADVPARASRSAPVEPLALPDWLHRPAPSEARPPRPLAPSSLGLDAASDPPPTPTMRAAAERGRLIHALFERLPPVAAPERAGAADRWLAQAGGVGDATARAAIIADVLRVIEAPDFAELFGADALAEAPIAAVIGAGLVVSGTVDRLLVRPDRVMVVDFKTSRRPPATLAEVPAYHLRQIAAYAAALAVIFPDRRVEAALLYTAAPVLFAIPPDLLSAHKPGFANTEQSFAAAS